MLPLFEGMDDLEYCIGCQDMGSGEIGTFAYSATLCAEGAGLWAISPVFDNVDDFYSWAKQLGFRYHSMKGSFVLTKIFPV
jgi:hypothetical protein